MISAGKTRTDILPDAVGIYSIPLEKDQETVLFLKGHEPESLVIAPVANQSDITGNK